MSPRGSCSASRGSGDVAQPDGEHHLRLVVEVPAQRRRPHPGGEQQLRGAQRVGGDDHVARTHLVVAAVPAVADDHPDGTAVLHQHPAHLRLGEQRGRRVGPGLLAEDDVGAAPHQRAVVPDVHGQRHRPDPALRRATGVELGAQPLADHVGVRRAGEGVPGDAEQPLRVVQELVEVGQEVDRSASPGRGQAQVQCAPIPPTLRGHRQRRDPVLPRLLEPVGEQVRARADHPLRRVGVRRLLLGGGVRPQALGAALGDQPLVEVGDVLHVHARRVGQCRADLEHGDGRAGCAFAQHPGVGRAVGTAADDRDVDGRGEGTGHLVASHRSDAVSRAGRAAPQVVTTSAIRSRHRPTGSSSAGRFRKACSMPGTVT